MQGFFKEIVVFRALINYLKQIQLIMYDLGTAFSKEIISWLIPL
jgi:hypothetical protein